LGAEQAAIESGSGSNLAAVQAVAGGSLAIPQTINGYPTNVGLLIIGHSTSQTGDYPSKLISALKHSSNAADGRHYLKFDGTHGSDGGFLWSRVSIGPNDLQYNRVKASHGPTASGLQWCEDENAVRWSCRRAKVEKILTGTNPLPTTGSCAGIPQDKCSPEGSSTKLMTCTYYDRNRPLSQNPVTEQLSHNACWAKMDFHVALIQDTSNRSWPLDDYTNDGAVTAADFWPSSKIKAEALPCGSRTGVVNGSVDWNCDGAITGADAAVNVYAGWMQSFMRNLIDTARHGAAAVDHVFITQKPLELGPGTCTLFPASELAACRTNHAVRTPAQILATPNRPYDRHYLPTVFWEFAAIDRIFAGIVDARIHRATPTSRQMYDRSAKGYDIGLVSSDWTIPAAVPGRPTTVAADDTEIDTDPVSANTVGTLNQDHIHHTEAGGWMMADVWFAGLKPFLQ
jgi:hypothetical protein